MFVNWPTLVTVKWVQRVTTLKKLVEPAFVGQYKVLTLHSYHNGRKQLKFEEVYVH